MNKTFDKGERAVYNTDIQRKKKRGRERRRGEKK